MKKKFVTRRLSQLRPHPRQNDVFAELSPAALQDLADDIAANGLINPVEINGANVIIAGHGRVAAAQLLGWPEIDCWLRDDLSDEQADRRHVEDNLHRRQLSKLEMARAYQALLELDRDELRNGAAGDLRDVVGQRLGLSGRTLDRLLRVLETPIEVQQAFDAGRIPLVQAGQIAGLPQRVQTAIAKQLRAGRCPKKVLNKYLPAKTTAVNVGRELGMLSRALDVAGKNIGPNLERVSRFHSQEREALVRGQQLLTDVLARMSATDGRLAQLQQAVGRARRRR